jgi:thiol-disulfide isomerase/thioredoxin
MKNILLLTLLVISLTACTVAVPDSEIGAADAPPELKPAPEFDLAAFPDGTLNSLDLKGKVVVVDFWATWCVPCIKEIPDLNTLYHEQDPEKFAMIGVTIQSGAHEDVEPYIEELGIEYPVVMGTEAMETGFGGIIGYPTKFVVGPDWTIYKKYLGGEVKEQLEQDIRDLTGESEVAQAN